MQNKTPLNLIILGFILIAGGVFFFWRFSQPPSAADKPDESTVLKINKTTLNELAKPKNYGQSISTDEPGFGRENPFAPYK